MNPYVTTADTLDAIDKVIEHLPVSAQGVVWQRITEAAKAYQEQRMSMDDFVLRLLPNNLFTPEELQILRAAKALPEIAQA